MDIPASKTFYGTAVAGSDGRLWVGPADWMADPTVFQVFDSAGAYLGEARIPGRFTVHDSGPGWVLGLVRDESEVEYVRRYTTR